MPGSRKLRFLPRDLFMLPDVDTFKFGGCSQLGEFFRRFLHCHSAGNGRSMLKTLYFGDSDLSDADLHTILVCFPKLEELIASGNNFVSLPACINKESVHMTNLDVSFCKKLQKIPECTNLKILNVHGCVKLEHISELPSTIQKVDARYCLSLTEETSDMLWYLVSKEIRGLEIVMPQTEIPKWFDYGGRGGNPCFWARGKFPTVVLALVFQGVNGRARQSRRQLVELQLIINGQCIPRKGYYNFRIEADHVLVCDLRVLFSEEEWLDLDAFLEHEWNQVQVSYEAPSTVTLSHWGVFVYRQGTDIEDVQFICPDPKYSYLANISPATFPTTTRDPKWEQMKMIEKLALDITFYKTLIESKDFEKRYDFEDLQFAVENMHVLMSRLKEISEEAKDVLEGKALDDKISMLAQMLEAMKKYNDKIDGPVIFLGDLALLRVKDGIKLPMDVGEPSASTSGQQGNSAVQGSDPQLQEIIMTEIFLGGIGAGLCEAKSSFPSLDIDTTLLAAVNKGNRARVLLQGSEVKNQVEMKIYMEGITSGLLEAKLDFPTLDVKATLNTVLSKGGIK